MTLVVCHGCTYEGSPSDVRQHEETCADWVRADALLSDPYVKASRALVCAGSFCGLVMLACACIGAR